MGKEPIKKGTTPYRITKQRASVKKKGLVGVEVSITVKRLKPEQKKFLSFVDPLNFDLAHAVDSAGIDDVTLENWLANDKSFTVKFFELVGFTLKQFNFIKLFGSKACNVSNTCKAVGVSRETYRNWIKASPLFKHLVDDILEAQIDMVETFLHKKIQEGDTISTLFFLKTKGKSRGYVEKQEIESVVTNKSELAAKTDEELDELIERLEKRNGGK